MKRERKAVFCVCEWRMKRRSKHGFADEPAGVQSGNMRIAHFKAISLPFSIPLFKILKGISNESA
jgi:hypothetical protein